MKSTKAMLDVLCSYKKRRRRGDGRSSSSEGGYRVASNNIMTIPASVLCLLMLTTRVSDAFGPERFLRRPPAALRATREPPPKVTEDDRTSDYDVADGMFLDLPKKDQERERKDIDDGSSNGSNLPGTADAFDAASQAILEWTSGTSIGAFLLQRQREEEDTVVLRELNDQTGEAEMTVQTLSDAERLVRDQSRRMEKRKRRRERRREREVQAKLESIRDIQKEQKEGRGVRLIIDDTAKSGVGKKIIEDEKSSREADASKVEVYNVGEQQEKKSSQTIREERKRIARKWRRRKRDKAKSSQKGFLVDEVRSYTLSFWRMPS